jgi:GT2 family glycosyltransferase
MKMRIHSLTVDEPSAASIDPARVTFIIATHNRRNVLLGTLKRLTATWDLREPAGPGAIRAEIIVIDNACTDGTADAVAKQYPSVRILRQSSNRGACAKNAGVPLATGQYIVFLDDDSNPAAGSTRRMVEYFQSDQNLGALVFDVVLRDGSRECSAYPTVFIGCGVGFRREALTQVGGLPDDFFYQAEEYDLSLRLLDAGWEIRRSSDLQVQHLKTKTGRFPARTTRLDARNNFTLITRYFPRQWILPFAVAWMRRYRWIAQTKSWRHRLAFWVGLVEGIARSLRPGHRRPVSSAAFERFAMIRQIENRMKRIADEGHRSVLFIDVGKNILPYALAARACGLHVVAIADKTLARSRRRFYGIPIVEDSAAVRMVFDVAVISNVSPVHVAQRLAEMRGILKQPVFDLLEAREPRQPRETIALVA